MQYLLVGLYAKVIMTAHEPVLKTVGAVKGMGIDTSLWRYGSMVELADTFDLSSNGLDRASSSLATPTNNK